MQCLHQHKNWPQFIFTYMYSENVICICDFLISQPFIYIHMCQLDIGGPNLPFSTVSLYGLIQNRAGTIKNKRDFRLETGNSVRFLWQVQSINHRYRYLGFHILCNPHISRQLHLYQMAPPKHKCTKILSTTSRHTAKTITLCEWRIPQVETF